MAGRTKQTKHICVVVFFRILYGQIILKKAPMGWTLKNDGVVGWDWWGGVGFYMGFGKQGGKE